MLGGMKWIRQIVSEVVYEVFQPRALEIDCLSQRILGVATSLLPIQLSGSGRSDRKVRGFKFVKTVAESLGRGRAIKQKWLT